MTKEELKEYHRRWYQNRKNDPAFKRYRYENQKKWARENKEKCREKCRKYYLNNKEYFYEYNRGWKKKNKEMVLAQGRRRRLLNPEKVRTRRKTHYYISVGVIKKPKQCQKCHGKFERKLLHAHHKNYKDPFDVLFVCNSCHRTIHGVHGK